MHRWWLKSADLWSIALGEAAGFDYSLDSLQWIRSASNDSTVLITSWALVAQTLRDPSFSSQLVSKWHTTAACAKKTPKHMPGSWQLEDPITWKIGPGESIQAQIHSVCCFMVFCLHVMMHQATLLWSLVCRCRTHKKLKPQMFSLLSPDTIDRIVYDSSSMLELHIM